MILMFDLLLRSILYLALFDDPFLYLLLLI